MVTLPNFTQRVYAFVKAILLLLILYSSQMVFSQNVGIGTLTPEDKLHILGNLRVSGGKIYFVNSGGSVFVGYEAGLNDDLSENLNVFLGQQAGRANITGSHNIAIGAFSLQGGTNTVGNIAIGNEALGAPTLTGGSNVAVGLYSLYSNTTGVNNVAVGMESLKLNTTGNNNTAFGHGALLSSETGNLNSGFGFLAGLNNKGNSNTFLGHGTGWNNVTGNNNVFIGHQAGFNETGSDKLYIANTFTATPLIYGDFLAKKLTINDTLVTNRLYIKEGANNGYLLKSNAAGKVEWTNPASLFNNVWSISGNDIYKNNTGNVGIGTVTPLEKLHVKGNMALDSGRISFLNTGRSVWIGEESGLNDDLSENRNVFIGYNAGKANITGHSNTAIGYNSLKGGTSTIGNIAIGYEALAATGLTGGSNVAVGLNALYKNTSGTNNVAVGSSALTFNTTGSNNTAFGEGALLRNVSGHNNSVFGSLAGLNNKGSSNTFLGYRTGWDNENGNNNVFIGYEAGYLETGSDKLYISNSYTPLPLVYGDFLAKKLTINDTLVTNRLYIKEGANNGYLLKSNAAGKVEWTNPATLFNNVWSISGNDIYKNNTGNVGIGIVTPVEKLHVKGSMAVDSGRISILNTGGSVFIGEDAGIVDDLTDNENVFIGHYSGKLNTTGARNTAIGNAALSSSTTASFNTAVGNDALSATGLTGERNTAIGYEALKSNTSGQGNVSVGSTSMKFITTGYDNVAIGSGALFKNTTGNSNVVIGRSALVNHESGNYNTIVGTESGLFKTSGNNNSFFGRRAGISNTSGSGNVFLGNEAGFNETGSNKLYISNSLTSTPLIYGEFDTKIVTINDTLNVKGKLDVVGNIELNNGRLAMVNPNLNIFIGEYVGEDITTGLRNNAIGFSALSNTSTGLNNIAFGTDALKTNVTGSNNTAIGNFALQLGTSINGTVAIGHAAGYNSAGIDNVYLGYNAGYFETGSNKLYIDNSSTSTPLLYGEFDKNRLTINDTLISKTLRINSGKLPFVNTGKSVFIGDEAGKVDDLTDNENIFIGYQTAKTNTVGAANTIIGNQALLSNIHGHHNVAIGNESMHNSIGGDFNVAIGYQSGRSTDFNDNTFVGSFSGLNNSGSGNVFLGNRAGENETGSNKLYISNFGTATPLIYGEFDKSRLTINDTVVTERIYFTEGATDGYTLISNSAGRAIWSNPNNLFSNSIGNIGIGTSMPADKVEIVGSLRLNAGRLNFSNTGNSIFIGNNAGAADDLTDNKNTFIGFNAGLVTTTGNNNIALGYGSLESNTVGYENVAVGNGALKGNGTGFNNVALGHNALQYSATSVGNIAIGSGSLASNNGTSNVAIGTVSGLSNNGNGNVFVGVSAGETNNGNNNVFIGSEAGRYISGSNKLVIDNTNTATPLVFGEFDSNQIGINTTAPSSTFEVSGTQGATFKNNQIVDAHYPDENGMIYRYTSGGGTILLPLASNCPNRMYVIINHTTGNKNISLFKNLLNVDDTVLEVNTTITIVSDGVGWFQIK